MLLLFYVIGPSLFEIIKYCRYFLRFLKNPEDKWLINAHTYIMLYSITRSFNIIIKHDYNKIFFKIYTY